MYLYIYIFWAKVKHKAHLLEALFLKTSLCTVSRRRTALPTIEQLMWNQTIACVGFAQWRKTSVADVVSLCAIGHRADGAWMRSVTGLLRGDFITSTCLSGRVSGDDEEQIAKAASFPQIKVRRWREIWHLDIFHISPFRFAHLLELQTVQKSYIHTLSALLSRIISK